MNACFFFHDNDDNDASVLLKSMSTSAGAITLVDMRGSWCIQVQTMKKTGEKSILSHSVTVSQIVAYNSVTVSPIIAYVCDLCVCIHM